MIAILGLEAIGDNIRNCPATERAALGRGRATREVRQHLLLEQRRPWVARVTGSHLRMEREFLQAKKDYTKANGQGSRGVYLYYTLREGERYDVHELVSWGRVRRYFARAEMGAVVEVSREEMDTWLSRR